MTRIIEDTIGMVSEAVDVILVGGHKDLGLGGRFVAVWRRNQEIWTAIRLAEGWWGGMGQRNEDHHSQQKD